MSRSKAGRYGTMLELAEDIRDALELRPVKARRPGPVLRAKRFAQRHAGYVLLVCMIVAVSALVLPSRADYSASATWHSKCKPCATGNWRPATGAGAKRCAIGMRPRPTATTMPFPWDSSARRPGPF